MGKGIDSNARKNFSYNNKTGNLKVRETRRLFSATLYLESKKTRIPIQGCGFD
jgi:hypothetical protein